MFSELVLAPSYRLLLRRLLAEVRGRTSPLSPTWIVTPTSTLAAHLRLQVAGLSRSGAIPAVRILPLLSFFEILGELGETPPGPRWSKLLDLKLFQLVSEEPLGARLAVLKQIRGGYQLLRPTFLDLADAGFGPSEAPILADMASEDSTDETAREVIEAYLKWLKQLLEEQIPWAPLVYQELAGICTAVPESELGRVLHCAALDQARVCVYGFYDFTDVAANVLTALAQRAPTLFFVPFSTQPGDAGGGTGPHHAFTFVQPVIDDLRARLGSSLGRLDYEPAAADGPVRFFLTTFPDGPMERQPSFLTFQRAMGRRAEVLSAAVRVRDWLDDLEAPIEPGEILVVAPDTEAYASTMREVFGAFAAPVRFVDIPDVMTVRDRILRAIVRLWEEQAPVEWLLGYCREFSKLPCLKGIDLDHFETKLRDSGFDGRNWAGLTALSADLRLDKAEIAFIEEVVAVWTRPEPSASQTIPAGTLAAHLERISTRWLPDTELLSDELALIRSLPPARSLPLEFVLDLLVSGTGHRMVQDPDDRPGVLFVPLMRARGLTPRAVVLLGLASGSLPFEVREDPLLADGIRAGLSQRFGEIGHRLSPKSVVSEEMALLFLLINGSAERIHWVIPSTDEEGRTVAATPWVQRYLQHWGASTDSDAGGAALFRDPVPRGPADQSRLLLRLDSAEGRFLPPAFAAHLDQRLGALDNPIPYGYLLPRLERKAREPEWSGSVPAARFPFPRCPTTLRVTELERLSKCPFQFYSHLIAGWEALEAVEPGSELPSTVWGSLLHYFFESVISAYRGRGFTLRAIADELLNDGDAALIMHIDRIPTETFPAFALLPPLFQRATRVRLLQTARDYWRSVQTGEIPDGVNIATEVRCSADYPGLPGILLSGQIDRLDQREGNRVIIDYKSGRAPERLTREVNCGFRLQPVLYRWLYEKACGASGDPLSFRYVFFGKPPFREKTVDGTDGETAIRWLALLAGELEHAIYAPMSNEALELLGHEGLDACRYCTYVSLCRRFERGAAVRFAHLLQERFSERLQALRED